MSSSQDKTTTYITLDTKNARADVEKAIIDIISQNKSKEMMLTKIIQELAKKFPGFNYQEFGFTRFSKFISSIESIVVKNNAAKIK